MKRVMMIFALLALSTEVQAQDLKYAEPPSPYAPEGLIPLSDEQQKALEVYAFDTVICKVNAVPSGFVIVAEGSSVQCPGSFPNTWTIKRPGVTEVVCKVSPIPSSYVIQGEGSSVQCPGSFPNTWTIRRV